MKMIQRLQLLEHLTPTEQILVDYLKENPEEFIGLNQRKSQINFLFLFRPFTA